MITRRSILIAVVYFVILAASSIILAKVRPGCSSVTTNEAGNTKECVCPEAPKAPISYNNKIREDITHLNKTVTDFRSQIEFMRQHQFAARHKMIEEREHQRTESRYYTETKKLAICFSGFLRNFSLTEQRIRNELFSLFGEENIDIFMYVPQVINNDQIQPLPNISWSVTELRTYKQQDLREPKSGYLYHYRTNFQGWLQQYYGIAGCYNVIREYQERTRIKYEWIARARPDVVYFYPDTFKNSFSLENLASNDWWIPDNQHWDGANDKFMLSSNTNYELYADFDNVYYYTGLFKPEIYHKATVELLGIKIKILKNFTTKIVRENGSYNPW